MILGTLSSLAGIAALAWGLFWPCRIPPPAQKRSLAEKQMPLSNSAKVALDSMADWPQLWARALRRPLVDKPAAAATQSAIQAKPLVPLNVVLVGTIVEEGHSRAMLSTAAGVVEVLGIGETVGGATGGAEIVEIQSNSVVLRYRGELTTVRLKGADES